MIRHRQGIAILPVAGLELAFEIGRPDLVRVIRLQRGRARMRPLPSAPILPQQVVPVGRATPYRSQSSVIDQWPLLKSRTNCNRSSATFVSIQGILLV